jgi:16S rRNA (uracil1498-N3)-methyltransferase
MAGLFYFPELGENDTTVTLSGEEARHAAAVRRIRPGEEISLTNGQGLMVSGKVISVNNKPSSLEISIQQSSEIPRPRLIHLVSAMPKGDRQRVLLEMAVQVGVSEFTPLICERSVGKENEKATERWRRICLEAMKQSRRAWLPRVNPSADLNVFLDSLPADSVLVCASAAGDSVLGMRQIEVDREIAIVVGPEGGFTGDELALLRQKGALEFNLGEGVLRTETAAVVAAALTRLLAEAK